MKVFIIAVIVMVLIEVLFIMYSDPEETVETYTYYSEEDEVYYKHDHIVLWDLISRIPVAKLCDILKHFKGLKQVAIKNYVLENNKQLFATDINGVICFACSYVDHCGTSYDGLLACEECCPVRWVADSCNFYRCMDNNSTYILWIEQIAYMSDLLTKCDYDCTDLEVLATYERMCELARTIRDSWRCLS